MVYDDDEAGRIQQKMLWESGTMMMKDVTVFCDYFVCSFLFDLYHSVPFHSVQSRFSVLGVVDEVNIWNLEFGIFISFKRSIAIFADVCPPHHF